MKKQKLSVTEILCYSNVVSLSRHFRF